MTQHDPRTHGQASFVEPKASGYLYLGKRVAPPVRLPVVRGSARRNQEIERWVAAARELENRPEVLAATVYEAALIPPVADSPRFDVLMLIETTSPEDVPAVRAAAAAHDLKADVVMPARNLRRIGDIDRPRSSTFLFNHFWADDREGAVATFEDIAGWFTDCAGVQDSALLQPVDDSAYVFVNHVRLPTTPIRFMLQFAKPSFRRSVAATLRTNRIGNAPVICRTVAHA